jgi:hypothetical protein
MTRSDRSQQPILSPTLGAVVGRGLLTLAFLAAAACRTAAPAAPETAPAAAQAPVAEAENDSGTPRATPEVPTGALGRALAEKSRQEAAAGPVAPPTPPDGDWLVDDEGNEYFLWSVPKRYGYKKKEGGKVHLAWGVEMDLAAENDEELFVKVYRTDDVPPAALQGAEPTEEELAAAARAYELELATGDRLELRPIGEGLPRRAQWRNSFALVDFDSDGRLEIVHGPPRKGGDQPVVLRRAEGGPWTPLASPPRVPSGLLDYGDVAVADFDGDGRSDLAFASHLRGIRAFRQTDDGGFETWSAGLDFSIPGQGGNAAGFTSRRLATLDWNGDGRPDLVALDEGPHMLDPKSLSPEERRLGLDMVMFGPVVYVNEGDGSWTKIDPGEASFEENFGDDLVVADFDGDGRDDFATSSNRMGRKDLVHLNQGGGEWRSLELQGLRRLGYVRAVAAADFDGDGRTDLALSYVNYDYLWRAGIDLYLNRGGEAWERRTAFVREGRVAFTALEAGNLDGDGRADLVALDMDGGGLILLGEGDGSFRVETEPALDQPVGRCRAYQVRLADLDGDGRDEVVASYADEANALWDPLRCPSGGGMAAWSPALR